MLTGVVRCSWPAGNAAASPIWAVGRGGMCGGCACDGLQEMGDVPRSPLWGKQCWYLGFWHGELHLMLHQLLSSGSW